MTVKHKLIKYSASNKLSDLIHDKYHMLLVLNRFGIDLGFGDDTVAQVCEQYSIDTNTFLAVANTLIKEQKSKVLSKPISLECLMSYLKNSHTYFREFKLPEIREKLKASIQNNQALSKVIMSYYDEYTDEVNKHMQYEEEVVFDYVANLIEGKATNFNTLSFSEHHQSVESKLAELKRIIIKYYHTKTTNELSSVLFDIFTCEKDLVYHSDIEDYLLIPAIRILEEKL